MRILVLYPGLVDERRQLMARHMWRLKLSRTRLILADDQIHPEDAGAFGDVLKLPNAAQAEAAWETLVDYLERHPVDGILAQSETGLLLGARLAREFGLPGPSVDAVMATVNKYQTRSLLQRAGIRQPAFALATDPAEVLCFGRRHGWPVVLKAAASSRQRLVTLVRSEAEVPQAVGRMLRGLPEARDIQRMAAFARLEGIDLGLDPQRQFLVESFQGGLPLECDAMLSQHGDRWFGLCEQVPSRDARFFIEGYLLPARTDPGATERALAAAQDAVVVLGLGDTGSSVELRLDADGPSIIEVNGRLPWDEGLQEFVQSATGSIPGALALRVAMGRRLPRMKAKRHVALLYRSNYAAGRVHCLPEGSHWKELTRGATAAWMIAKEGDELLAAEHPDSRPHVAAVLTADKHSTDRALASARALLDKVPIEIHARHSLSEKPKSLQVIS